jgi:hypothetical protein
LEGVDAVSDGELDRLRHEQDDVNREDTRALIVLVIMAVGIIIASAGAQILRWLL